MAIYAMSDLHLALSADKPMEVFGDGWQDYMDRIFANWNSVVGVDDTVLVGGDVSWATYIDKAKEDFDFLHRLNGKKIISKGNHDYWWESLTKLQNFVSENGFTSITFMHNNGFVAENIGICGTRGWTLPDSDSFSSDDVKMYERELIRFALSAEDMAKKIKSSSNVSKRVAVLHYPPIYRDGTVDDGFNKVIKEYKIDLCLYGHLHSYAHKNAFCGAADGTEYRLVSADYMKFCPYKLNF